MNILFAIQGTGNGHLSRARAVIPHLHKYGSLDLLVSGTEADVQLPYELAYQLKGISFLYNRKGGINYSQTLRHNPPKRILNEVRHFPIEQYDLVINDFEPISAWAAKLKGVPCIALSHQAAYLSPVTPRPNRRSVLGEFILHQYAPVEAAVGFHFKSYDAFIHTPVIREEIRNAQVTDAGHYTVYLPAIGDEPLQAYLASFPEISWHVFSRYTSYPYTQGNIQVFPIENDNFIESFTSCTGILTSAGFETPAEAIFMGKKLLVSPIKGQYEQLCNAEGLKELGIQVVDRFNSQTKGLLQEWLNEEESLQILFPDETAQIIDDLVQEDSTQLNLQPQLALA